MAAKGSSKSDNIYHLKIVLDDIEPSIWRLLQVSGDATLAQLHVYLQIAMGWEGQNAHRFVMNDSVYGPISGESEETDNELVDERGITLHDAVVDGQHHFAYDYNFEDGWCHTVSILKTTKPKKDQTYPLCEDGERSAPPEGCGGPYEYERLLNILENPEHSRYVDVVERCGDFFDPEGCDLDDINELLKSPDRRFAKS